MASQGRLPGRHRMEGGAAAVEVRQGEVEKAAHPGTQAHCRLSRILRERPGPWTTEKAPDLLRGLPGAGAIEKAAAARGHRCHTVVTTTRLATRAETSGSGTARFPWQPLGNKQGGESCSARRKWDALSRPAPGAGGRCVPRRAAVDLPRGGPGTLAPALPGGLSPTQSPLRPGFGETARRPPPLLPT